MPMVYTVFTLSPWINCLSQNYLASHQGTARLMFNSFGSSLWMMPFSKHCRADNIYLKHFSAGSKNGHLTYVCDDHEFQANYSGWPTNIINIEIPTTRGMKCNNACTIQFQWLTVAALKCMLDYANVFHIPPWQEMKLILHL